jgi:hypothetical protein
MLDSNYDSWGAEFPLFHTNKLYIQGLIRNMLLDISWDDNAVRKEISHVLLNMSKHPDFRELVSENVKGLRLRAGASLRKLKKFPHVESLLLKRESREVSFTVHLGALKRLTFEKTTHHPEITAIEGLENFPNLKHLNLNNVKVSRILLSKPLEKLKTLSLVKSTLSQLPNLEYFPNLKELNCKNTTNLTKLSFTKDNKDLVLKLHNSRIKLDDIEGIEHLDSGKIHF